MVAEPFHLVKRKNTLRKPPRQGPGSPNTNGAAPSAPPRREDQSPTRRYGTGGRPVARSQPATGVMNASSLLTRIEGWPCQGVHPAIATSLSE
jgi:hypothetical protein